MGAEGSVAQYKTSHYSKINDITLHYTNTSRPYSSSQHTCRDIKEFDVSNGYLDDEIENPEQLFKVSFTKSDNCHIL